MLGVSDLKVVTLCFVFVILLLLLVYLYRKLNHKTNGQFTARTILYRTGGVRDQVRSRVRTLEARLGRRLWPLNEDEEVVGEEGERDAERDVERGSERGESDGDEDQEEDEGDDLSDDYSSMEGCDLRAKSKDRDESEGGRESLGNVVTQETRDEAKEAGEVKRGVEEGEGNGGGDLVISLKHFSGSAIWSEEQKNMKDDDNNMTAL